MLLHNVLMSTCIACCLVLMFRMGLLYLLNRLGTIASVSIDVPCWFDGVVRVVSVLYGNGSADCRNVHVRMWCPWFGLLVPRLLFVTWAPRLVVCVYCSCVCY